MQQIRITLKNEKLKFYNWINWIFIFLHAVVFAYLLLVAKVERVYNGSLLALILMAASMIRVAYKARKRSLAKIDILLFYFSLIIGWVITGQYYFVIIPLFFGLLYLIASRKFSILVRKENIVYPAFPKRILSWNKINDIILKDGLLTINLKNNKLIQQMIEDNKTSAEEKEFNDFCNKELRQNRPADPDNSGLYEGISELPNMFN